MSLFVVACGILTSVYGSDHFSINQICELRR
uniref:Uncharacterized protein n=1 Tax=Anguilla anguilla TaxID=7936 RepID=A0A0E9RW17_ANGAN